MMEQDLKGYRVVGRKSRQHWAEICEEWILLIERFARVEEAEEDASYWYNELTDVAVLSGAAWRCGWIAVTETQVEKGVKHRPKHFGRADLYIAREERGEYIEAKHEKFSMKANRDFDEIFDPVMERALADARQTAGSDDIDATAVGFFAPYAPQSYLDKKDDLEELIEETLEAAIAYNSHVTAWCFPKRSRHLQNHAGTIWPGAIMMAKNIHI